MLPPPEPDPYRRARALLTTVLIVGTVLVAGFLIVAGDGLVSKPPPFVAPTSAAPAFAGASKDRLFLTQSDQAEAIRRGLVPEGTRSILSTGKTLQYGEWRWDDMAVPTGPVKVRVDLGRQLVSVFRGGDEIGTAVILYGGQGKDTPTGQLPILGKTRDYHSITYDAPMPYSLWLRDDGVALHGSTVTSGRATNGCIGVPDEFAARIFPLVEKGDIIEVIAG